MMDQIRLLEMMDGKSGGTHKNKKDMADHKFWATQPVRRLDERTSFSAPHRQKETRTSS
jgi:glycylpeptide N-tetradecanoyltransferase